MNFLTKYKLGLPFTWLLLGRFFLRFGKNFLIFSLMAADKQSHKAPKSIQIIRIHGLITTLGV